MPSGATVKALPPVEKRDPFDFPAKTDSITYQGVEYVFKELTVAETDECREGATLADDKFDGRLMTRLMVCASSHEPKITLELLTKLPQSLYVAMMDLVNDINDPESLTTNKDETLGKS